MTADEYRKYLEMDFDDIDINDMKDITDIRIDSALSIEQKRSKYIKNVGNPYLVRVGDMKVKVRFANNGISFEEAFENMLLSM